MDGSLVCHSGPVDSEFIESLDSFRTFYIHKLILISNIDLVCITLPLHLFSLLVGKRQSLMAMMFFHAILLIYAQFHNYLAI